MKACTEAKALDQYSKDLIVILALQLLALGKLNFVVSIFIISVTRIIIPTYPLEKRASVKLPRGLLLCFGCNGNRELSKIIEQGISMRKVIY